MSFVEQQADAAGKHILKETLLKGCPNCLHTLSDVRGAITDWQQNTYQICRGCGCWVQNPQRDIAYETTYWGVVKDPDGNVRDLTKERDSRIRNWYCETVPFVNSLKPGRILDVGAGLGFFLSAINDQWEKHALDISERAISFINENQPNVTTHQGLLESNTFKDMKFDVVMAYHVIEHVPSPAEFLANIHRILAPGGTAIIGTPNIGSIAARWFKGNFRLLGNGHLCLFNPQSLEKACVEQGLRVKNVRMPYWQTDYAKPSQMLRMLDRKKLSPAFWGNVMNFYCTK